MSSNSDLTSSWLHRFEQETLSIQKINRGEDPYFIIPFLEGDNEIFALYAVFNQKDYKKAKNYFYKTARIAEYMSIKYDWRVIDTGMKQISYALLSDNSDLIRSYSLLKNTVNDVNNLAYQLPNSVQNILLNNLDGLDVNLAKIRKSVNTVKYAYHSPTFNVLQGFRNEDKDQIASGLNEMLATYKKRNKDPLVSKFLSFDTAGLCKLAWLKGYEIDLQSSLVPTELMAIKPLDVYEDYDFLKRNIVN